MTSRPGGSKGCTWQGPDGQVCSKGKTGKPLTCNRCPKCKKTGLCRYHCCSPPPGSQVAEAPIRAQAVVASASASASASAPDRSRSPARIPACRITDAEMLQRMRSQQRGRVMPDWILQTSWGYAEGTSWAQGISLEKTDSWLKEKNVKSTKLRLYLGWVRLMRAQSSTPTPQGSFLFVWVVGG